MKPIIWIQLLIFCVGIGQPWALRAQDSFRSREKMDSLINPPLMKQAEQILRFDKTVLNIGTLTEDDFPQTYRFTCENTCKKTLTITRVRTTCGCVGADVRTGDILPGETRIISLTFYPKNHPGMIDADAFVYLSYSDKTPVARLTLVGNVVPEADEWARYPYAMGKLRLKQNCLNFCEMNGTKQSSERILCGNSGDKPLRLSALIIPNFAMFRTEPEIIQAGCEADIIVTINPSLIPAERGKSFTFPIILDGIDVRPSDRTLNIKVNLH